MSTGMSILERIIDPRIGDFSSEHARYVLSLDFTNEQRAQYAQLAEKVKDDKLTPEEKSELDEFIAANALLTILQSKARKSVSNSAEI